MEIWILILAFGIISYTIIEIYENIQMNKWMCQRHLRELKLAMMQLEHPEFFSRTHDRRAMHTSGVTTGEVEVLGPGRIIFGEEMAD
jgi:hypothetical protein